MAVNCPATSRPELAMRIHNDGRRHHRAFGIAWRQAAASPGDRRRRRCRTACSSATLAFPPERKIEFRVSVYLGDVVEESDGDLMVDGVNIAARLEGIAKPG